MFNLVVTITKAPNNSSAGANKAKEREKDMRIGIGTDHGGFDLKEEMVKRLTTVSHEVIDLGAYKFKQEDDYPDFVIPLAKAVAEGMLDRGVAICGSGVGASVCANKIAGVRAGLIHDHFSARQGVEDDDMNILCMGGRTVGPEVAWELIITFLAAEFSHAERHVHRLHKVALLEKGTADGRECTRIEPD
jgi:ribose 5-phosphate isomerase B